MPGSRPWERRIFSNPRDFGTDRGTKRHCLSRSSVPLPVRGEALANHAQHRATGNQPVPSPTFSEKAAHGSI
jgi:hypothetical protein